VSSGDIRESRKVPSELCVSSRSHFSTFENVVFSGSHMKRITFTLITGLWSEIGAQTEVQWAGVSPGTAMEQTGNSTSPSITPKELTQCISERNDLISST